MAPSRRLGLHGTESVPFNQKLQTFCDMELRISHVYSVCCELFKQLELTKFGLSKKIKFLVLLEKKRTGQASTHMGSLLPKWCIRSPGFMLPCLYPLPPHFLALLPMQLEGVYHSCHTHSVTVFLVTEAYFLVPMSLLKVGDSNRNLRVGLLLCIHEGYAHVFNLPKKNVYFSH